MDTAPDISSNEAKEFQRAMRDNPAVYEIMRGIQAEFQNFANMTPMERTSAKIVNQVPEKSTLSKIVDGRFYEEFVDDLNPIKKLVDTFEKESGLKLKTSINPYELGRLPRNAEQMEKLCTDASRFRRKRGFKIRGQHETPIRKSFSSTTKNLTSRKNFSTNTRRRREYSSVCRWEWQNRTTDLEL